MSDFRLAAMMAAAASTMVIDVGAVAPARSYRPGPNVRRLPVSAKPKAKRKYKGSKAAKKASRRRKP